jgi:hypothetical protein
MKQPQEVQERFCLTEMVCIVREMVVEKLESSGHGEEAGRTVEAMCPPSHTHHRRW